MRACLELLVATRNKKKLEEIKEILSGMKLKITSLADYKDMPCIVEDGRTFAQNAAIKASAIAQFTKKLVLGEDSGLEVRALGNGPGVYSARYSGIGATDKKNNSKLLLALKKVPLKKRIASWLCNNFIKVAFLEFKLKDFSSLFKGFNKKRIKALNFESNEFDLGLELVLKAMRKKYKIAEVPVDWFEREQGESKLKLSKFAKHYLNRAKKIWLNY